METQASNKRQIGEIMGLFDKLFGNEEKKGGCCDIHIEEVAESQNAIRRRRM